MLCLQGQWGTRAQCGIAINLFYSVTAAAAAVVLVVVAAAAVVAVLEVGI